MSDDERFKCSVCSGIRKELHSRKSRLLKTVQLYLCNDCLKTGKEPRYLIILIARTKGAKAVEDYIIKRRYAGDPILGEEMLSRATN